MMFSYRFTKISLLGSASLLMCITLTQIAQSQQTPGTLPDYTTVIKTKDPVVDARELRTANSRRRPAPEEKNHHEIALAITTGNDARRNSKYDLAVTAYERAIKLDAKDPRGHYGLGNVYVDLSCPDSAIAEYRAALKLKNDFIDALIGLGYTLANKQRYEEAESQFQQLLKIVKDDTAGGMGLAFVSWKRKKYDDAIAGLNSIANAPSRKADDRAAAFLFLGDIYRERNKWDNARTAYQQAIALNSAEAANFISIQAQIGLGLIELLPAMERFSQLTREERKPEDHQQVISAARKAEEYFRRAIYDLHYDHPTGYLVWAFSLVYQFQFRDAEEKFNQYLKKVQELENQLPAIAKTKTCDYGFTTLRANYYYFQALSYQQERFLTIDNQKTAELDRKTIECLEQFIRLKADNAGGYSTLAGVYFFQGKYNAAIEQYDNALSRETDETKKASHYSGRGSSYEKIGRIKDAIDDFNRSINLQPEVPLYYWNLALIYEHQGNWDEAILAADKAMAHEQPPAAHSYFFYASLLFRRGRLKGNDADYEKAIEFANRAISINRSFPSAYLLLAAIYKNHRDASKVDEAISNYELAAQYEPSNPSIYFGLADLYFGKKGNDNAAIQNLTKAVALKPNYAQAYWLLGKSYTHKRNDEEAIKHFQNAIKYDPKLLDAYIDLADLYDERGNYEDAIKWLLKATEELPTDYLPYKEAARIYSRYKKNDEAIKYYEKAIDLVDRDLAWFGEIMKCRIIRLRAQYDESIACFQNIKMPSSGDPARIPYDVGLTHIATGNKQAAMGSYEELKRMKSNLADTLLNKLTK
jgi:tetratricopeptide (TPR) repeat protein